MRSKCLLIILSNNLKLNGVKLQEMKRQVIKGSMLILKGLVKYFPVLFEWPAYAVEHPISDKGWKYAF